MSPPKGTPAPVGADVAQPGRSEPWELGEGASCRPSAALTLHSSKFFSFEMELSIWTEGADSSIFQKFIVPDYSYDPLWSQVFICACCSLRCKSLSRRRGSWGTV